MWKLFVLSCILLLAICECKRTTTGAPPTTPSGKKAAKSARGATDESVEEGEIDPDAECSRKKRCKDRNQICSNGYCLCKTGYTSNADGTKCVKVPGFGERCDADKNNVLYCQGVGVSPICPDNGKCECEKGYEPKGRTCVFKDQNLNEKCVGDEDCGAAYASCQNGKCLCLSGFKADKGVCVSEVTCPSGDVLQEDGQPKSCEVKSKAQSFGDDEEAVESDDAESGTGCPSSHFCFANPMIRTKTGGSTGFCCPQYKGKVKAVCPAGESLKIKKCTPDVNDDGDFTENEATSTDTCPALSHSCVEINETNLCCPTPCPGHLTFFAFEGRCYETLAPGSSCKFDLQCGNRATCSGSKDKKCTCKEKFTEQFGACELTASLRRRR